jgi:TolB-like protein
VGAIATVVGGAIAVLAWWTTSQPRGPQPPAVPQAAAVSPPAKKSVAVLPFVNMTSDKENEYFSDGISEDLITALSKVSGLHVAARTSSFAFKGKNEPIEKIGAQLHVGAVLEGSVAKAGNQVRITAQLINVADEWSHALEPGFTDLQRLVEPFQGIAAVRPPADRRAKGIAAEALPRAVGDRGRHQHLRRSGKGADTGGEIDGETLDAGMRDIPIGAWLFAHLAHVDARAHPGEVGLFAVRLL